MKYITLSRGLFATIDDEDYESISQFKWYSKPNHKTIYAERNVRILNGKKRQTKILMHHIILSVSDGMEIDHIDGNGLNNQKSNLVVVTRRQNQQNRHHTKTSKYPGVIWHKDGKKWRSQIRINGKTRWLGLSESEDEAYIIYKVAEAVLVKGEPK